MSQAVLARSSNAEAATWRGPQSLHRTRQFSC
jgi:hypothetical protein